MRGSAWDWSRAHSALGTRPGHLPAGLGAAGATAPPQVAGAQAFPGPAGCVGFSSRRNKWRGLLPLSLLLSLSLPLCPAFSASAKTFLVQEKQQNCSITVNAYR